MCGISLDGFRAIVRQEREKGQRRPIDLRVLKTIRFFVLVYYAILIINS